MATLTLGTMVYWSDDLPGAFAKVRDMGLATCQLSSWSPLEISRVQAEAARAAADAAGIAISLFWCGYSGPAVWNYNEGPVTIGLVPPAYRDGRTAELKKGAEITGWLGLSDMATHVGFLPLNPQDPDYLGTVEALKEIVACCGEREIYFDFETGQETPMVLLRTMGDIGMPNVGINLDPANLLLYGNGNPVDALDIFGRYVRGVHAKDGEYPTDGYALGAEKALGEGRVNFPALIPKLKACGFAGTLTIEREISGDQQIADIKHAIELLTPLL